MLSPGLKRWGPPRQQELCSQSAHLWGNSNFVPRREEFGNPQTAGVYVANLPIYGPLLVLSPSLKRWGPPRWQGLCSQSAHLWVNSDLVPRFEALGTP